MKTTYFCEAQCQQLVLSESHALNKWSALMNRAIKAYIECRIDAAYIYFYAAFEIAYLRAQCPQNTTIALMHIAKPTEFLIQLYIAEQDFNKAKALLKKVTECEETFMNQQYDDFLACHYLMIENAEQNFFDNKECLFKPVLSKIAVKQLPATMPLVPDAFNISPVLH